MDRDIPNVTRIEEEDRLSCILDDSIFQCPAGYAQLGNGNKDYFFFNFYFILI